MKYLILLMLLVSQTASALHLTNKDAQLDVTTEKLTQIVGPINDDMVMQVYLQNERTSWMPGPRIILIDSGGGSVSSGQKLIEMLEAEKAQGILQVCVVTGQASSMAFNLLTHCDVRLAVRDAYMVVHKIFIMGDPGIKMTAKNLRRLADELDRGDEPFRQANCKAMHITLSEYDRKADVDTAWSSEILFRLHYLNGIVKLQ